VLFNARMTDMMDMMDLKVFQNTCGEFS